MLTQTSHAPSPSPAETLSALQCIADVLGMHTCWLYRCRWHFSVGAGFTIALSPDSAGRFRIDTCRRTRTVSSLWVLPEDRDSLAGIVHARRQLLDVPSPEVVVDEPCDLQGFD
jgi:hypothetical protein